MIDLRQLRTCEEMLTMLAALAYDAQQACHEAGTGTLVDLNLDMIILLITDARIQALEIRRDVENRTP